mmetsp:Transcript_21805/g.65138  ORF Transcript_21805/g.65138 Transcript_21805/m.65138 type:complete len:1455 (+) Transcript_21805:236-4600(+)|eukprot:CAMPEP_0182922042 /NCGR_PEP_ID=MMETSP0105_2-20130417/4541_1 /TAXON_ID=81532 ORGANISM="Acanthoeca-like sp., Strain 10tr" /NCGR_SAMPLE_ID=MMETSP0105_2 /ASSEMBLY_ACC=CAM_ASM_000205 /LENGTH=1454 /DNA_ID=CAMNT_0025059631 /DNA_START=67 /DNA_END=4431 /DNA_ORIENTATION=+
MAQLSLVLAVLLAVEAAAQTADRLTADVEVIPRGCCRFLVVQCSSPRVCVRAAVDGQENVHYTRVTGVAGGRIGCRERCANQADCVAYEISLGSVCELWTTLPNGTSLTHGNPGNTPADCACYKYAPRLPVVQQCNAVQCGARCFGPCGWNQNTFPRCTVSSSSAITTPTDYADGVCYSHQTNATCNATFPHASSLQECRAAAVAMGLPDQPCLVDNAGVCNGAAYGSFSGQANLTDAVVEGLPHGCWWKANNTVGRRLWFNPRGDRAAVDPERVAVCGSVNPDTAAPTFAPSFVPTLPTSHPTAAPTTLPTTSSPTTFPTPTADTCSAITIRTTAGDRYCEDVCNHTHCSCAVLFNSIPSGASCITQCAGAGLLCYGRYGDSPRTVTGAEGCGFYHGRTNAEECSAIGDSDDVCVCGRPVVSTAPTFSPSTAPTQIPSTRPTTTPTDHPTAAPQTAAPSHIPTVNPTHAPTFAPTTRPTFAPSTAVPTTLGPSASPTFAPTVSPTAAPSSAAPTTLSPTSARPTTLAPTTVAPTTRAPTTQAPTTPGPTPSGQQFNAPTSFAPTTAAPVTLAPASLAPTTLGPTFGLTLTPSAAVTSSPAPPTTSAPTGTGDEDVQSGASSSGSDGGGILPIIIVVVVLVALIAVLAYRRRQTQAQNKRKTVTSFLHASEISMAQISAQDGGRTISSTATDTLNSVDSGLFSTPDAPSPDNNDPSNTAVSSARTGPQVGHDYAVAYAEPMPEGGFDYRGVGPPPPQGGESNAYSVVPPELAGHTSSSASHAPMPKGGFDYRGVGPTSPQVGETNVYSVVPPVLADQNSSSASYEPKPSNAGGGARQDLYTVPPDARGGTYQEPPREAFKPAAVLPSRPIKHRGASANPKAAPPTGGELYSVPPEARGGVHGEAPRERFVGSAPARPAAPPRASRRTGKEPARAVEEIVYSRTAPGTPRYEEPVPLEEQEKRAREGPDGSPIARNAPQSLADPEYEVTKPMVLIGGHMGPANFMSSSYASAQAAASAGSTAAGRLQSLSNAAPGEALYTTQAYNAFLDSGGAGDAGTTAPYDAFGQEGDYAVAKDATPLDGDKHGGQNRDRRKEHPPYMSPPPEFISGSTRPEEYGLVRRSKDSTALQPTLVARPASYAQPQDAEGGRQASTALIIPRPASYAQPQDAEGGTSSESLAPSLPRPASYAQPQDTEGGVSSPADVPAYTSPQLVSSHRGSGAAPRPPSYAQPDEVESANLAGQLHYAEPRAIATMSTTTPVPPTRSTRTRLGPSPSSGGKGEANARDTTSTVIFRRPSNTSDGYAKIDYTARKTAGMAEQHEYAAVSPARPESLVGEDAPASHTPHIGRELYSSVKKDAKKGYSLFKDRLGTEGAPPRSSPAEPVYSVLPPGFGKDVPQETEFGFGGEGDDKSLAPSEFTLESNGDYHSGDDKSVALSEVALESNPDYDKLPPLKV